MTQQLKSCAVLIALVASAALGADSIPPVAARVYENSGQLMVEVSGRAPDASDWLAVAFLLPGQQVSPSVGRSVYSVKGDFRLPLPVPVGYEHGSYDVGLWRERHGEEVSLHPSGLKAYGSGRVAGGADDLHVADSLAELKTDIITRDGQKVLRVSGKARDDRWLAVAFHGAQADSISLLLYIPKGDFGPAIAIPAGYENGTYVTSLWVRLSRDTRAARMEGALGVVTGQIGD
jgi:hypothetical protein